MRKQLKSAFGLFAILAAIGSSGQAEIRFAANRLETDTTFSEAFVRTETFDTGATFREGAAVVYGSPVYGYFEMPARPAGGTKIELDFVPPGYRHRIRFYLKTSPGGKLRFLRSERYRSPVPDRLVQLDARSTGRFHPSFFLINHFVNVPGGGSVGPFPIILNRLGEIVWLHFLKPQYSVGPGRFLLAMKRVRPGVYAILSTVGGSAFHEVTIQGKILRNLNIRQYPQFNFVSHDFLYSEEKAELIAIGTRCRSHGFWADYGWYPAYRGLPEKILHLFTGLFWPRTYATNFIYRFDLNNGQVSVLWDSAEQLDFKEDQNLFGDAPQPLLLTRSLEQYRKVKLSNQGKQFRGCDQDWTHANSLFRAPDGDIVMSLRNLNRVVSYSPDFKSLRWSVGSSGRETFGLQGGDAFHSQHDASITRRNTVLMFDNNTPGWSNRTNQESRIVEYHLDRARQSADLIWEAKSDPPVRSPALGSVHELANGNFLGYFPTLGSSAHGLIVEFDYATRRPIATLQINPEAKDVGFKALPLETLGSERPFVGELH